jgi:magnesium transporter
MKKISGWATILFAPPQVGAIYGKNFDDMPELHWAFGYPMALGLMLGLGVVLYAVFRVKKRMRIPYSIRSQRKEQDCRH